MNLHLEKGSVQLQNTYKNEIIKSTFLMSLMPSTSRNENTSSDSPKQSLFAKQSRFCVSEANGDKCITPLIAARCVIEDVFDRRMIRISFKLHHSSLSNIPQRVFKIISIGNSKVGKSSIIDKFTTGNFNSAINTTIGVDVRMRLMRIEETTVMLQLWDTAGQERYRSITNQYFRKADGVVIVYDLTSEESFLDLRDWMQCVADGVDSGTPIMLLGNKKDMVSEVNPAAITKSAGERFANEYKSLFFEISAKTGENIEFAFQEIVRKLKLKEDMCLEAPLQLTKNAANKKRPCCS